ncbi:MAG: hypothetical protein MUE46_19015, partial [Xanthomonadales bacterium]|nr:hypothetical protein [Xanthomonadales bacterium]
MTIIVSFIGITDLEAAERDFIDHPTDKKKQGPGPIMRFLRWKADQNLPVAEVILLDDFRDQRSKDFKDKLKHHLQAALPNLPITLHPIDLRVRTQHAKSPTNLQLLYEEVFAFIETQPNVPLELVVSSGTPAMYATMVLVGEYLRDRRPRLFEASREEKVVELKLPYEIGLRKRKEPRARGRAAPRPPGLLPHTVITDPKVAEVYGQLRTLAVQPGRIKICLTGEAGSGKYRAAQQLAAWRGVSDVGRCFSPEPPAQPPAFLIVAQADLIPLDAFPHWNEWLEGHPEVQVVFLCRDHERAEALINGQGGLASGELQLRGWRERSDQLELVKAMLAEAGRPTTKVDERFQYELLRYPTVKNLHGLRAWLTTLAATSETPNISEAAIESVRQAPELWAKRRRLRRQLHQLLG